ncbi:GGDEF domain-containing protein [Silvibacterium dinghuense]|uniref:GGDEF domain-containing protein n=1 Tax=Silvibacterium dinghuense TaxID=1560006 RepID=UPI0013E94BCE|nr:GGDEF domain-containing protein [Silvibacterium dinghuense]
MLLRPPSPAPLILLVSHIPAYRALAAGLLTGVAVIALLCFYLWLRERQTRAHAVHLEAQLDQRTAALEEERRKLASTRDALIEQASRDPLTGLLNYGSAHDVLVRELSRAGREATSLTTILVEIDELQEFIDHRGHMAADEILRETAHRLAASIRVYDTVSRFGIHEFLILMPQFDGFRDPHRIQAVHDALCLDPVWLPGGSTPVSCSFGVAVLNGESGVTAEELLLQADKALQKAKYSGRNRIEYEVYHP